MFHSSVQRQNNLVVFVVGGDVVPAADVAALLLSRGGHIGWFLGRNCETLQFFLQ